MNALDQIIMKLLGSAQGRPIRMPSVAGATEEEICASIARLIAMRYVRVIGPPNAHSDLGQDIEELHLTPLGARAAVGLV